MKVDRRSFLKISGSSILGLVGLALTNTRCGNYSESYGSGGASPVKLGGSCLNNGVAAEVEMRHDPNHDLDIPKADVVAGVEKTYMLGDNGSGHVHEITITVADFAKLQQGQGIQVTSTRSGHTHAVTVNCV